MELADLHDIPPQSQPWPGSFRQMTPPPDHGEQSWTGRGRLIGKRVYISGGDSGIGRAIAIACAKDGADVAIGCLPDERGDAADTASVIEAQGVRALIVPADLSTRDACEQTAARVVEAFGGIDVLVCNAAFQRVRDRLTDIDDEQLERTFAVNVYSPLRLVTAFEPHLKAGASIVMTTSVQAARPMPDLLDYASTKAALTTMTLALAEKLGPRGIRVNAVAPGPIWTPLVPATMTAEQVAGYGAQVPLGRAGHPIEVAAAFVFLASGEASYISGTVIGVAGGRAL